jgi:hypothetical protein
VTPRFVFCVRDPTQVARSITARDRLATAQSEYRWLIYNAEAVLGVGRDAVCVVPYEDWFARPLETAERLAAFAGVAPDTDAVSRVVDASLRHDSFAPSPAGRMARRLHTLIEGCVDDQRFGAGVLAFCHGVVDFAQQVQPLLVDTEVLRASVLEQNRVIGDLNAALRAARLVGLKEEKAVLF